MLKAPPKLLDVVYPVRGGDNNDELRFSLRSLEANFPHATVWIVGYKPTWVQNVEYIPGNKRALHANIYYNLLEACRHPDISDELVVFNDDFFATEPVTEIPTLYRGTLQAHIDSLGLRRNSWWGRSLQTTQQCLHGITDPLSYELHTPFVAVKEAMRDTLERFADTDPTNPPQWRTLYGNLHTIGGAQAPDCKAYKRGTIGAPWHSTDDSSFRYFRTWFTEAFPNPSRYEL